MSIGVPCPSCGSAKGSVIDSRPKGDVIQRRRVCGDCQHRYNTLEKVANKHEKDRKFQVGEFVQSKVVTCQWRGEVVATVLVENVKYCVVASCYEKGSIKTIPEKNLKPWDRPHNRAFKWDEELVAALIAMRAQNASYLECEERIGAPYHAIQRKCRELGIHGKRNNGSLPGRSTIT